MEQVIADSTRMAELFVPVRPLCWLRAERVRERRGSLHRDLGPQKYYAALDKAPGPERTPFSFYSPESRIAWNGNPIPFADLPLFIERMPHSNHAVQAFDCHPIPGRSPRLLRRYSETDVHFARCRVGSWSWTSVPHDHGH